ncbi:unnamed protein product, partial [Larinioides sclopetarius]
MQFQNINKIYTNHKKMQNFGKFNSKSGIRAICAKLQSASIYVRVKLNRKFHEIL